MTANQDQIQRLLTEVQEVLAQRTSRLPWRGSAQLAQQRRVLKQVEAALKEILFQLNDHAVSSSEAQAQDVMQSVIEEMQALRSTLIRPLHAEVALLMQQRNALTREIRQLEAHRQLLEQPPASPEPAIHPSLQSAQTTHALTTFDTSLHLVFESLQRDLQAYQTSLAQGLDKLHHLGKRSEVMFSGIVERLATQIEQEASTRLQSASVSPSLPAQPAFMMPYAGSEFVPSAKGAARSPAIATITALTQLIDQIEISDADKLTELSPVVPLDNGKGNREVPLERKTLFELDLPCAERLSDRAIDMASDTLTHADLRPEPPGDPLETARPSGSESTPSAEATVSFLREDHEA